MGTQTSRRIILLETAASVGQQLTAATDLDSFLAAAVSLIQRNFGYYCAIVFLVDEMTGELVLREASGESCKLMRAGQLRLASGEESIVSRVVETGRPFLSNRISEQVNHWTTVFLPDSQAELAVPLILGAQVVGALDVHSAHRDGFDEVDLGSLERLGLQVAAGIQNARLFRETRSRYDAMVALHATSLDLVSQLDIEELLRALLSRGVDLWGARAGCVFYYDREQGFIRQVAGYNTPPAWKSARLRPGQGMVGRVALSGKPMIVNNYPSWEGRIDVFPGTSYTSCMGAPLKWQDEVIGVVSILTVTQTRPFVDQDLWLLALFADMASVAIKNAQLYTRVKDLTEGLEQQITERTKELVTAQREITLKAEQLRRLLSKSVRVQEEERIRIARDMHDGVVQLIAAALYELQATKVAIESGRTADLLEMLRAVRSLLCETEREMRRVISGLHPSGLDALGLVESVNRHLTRVQGRTGLVCRLETRGTPRRLQLPMEVAVFRIVEEAVQNITTHAAATAASVVFNFGATALHVVIQDDGVGFDCQRDLETYDGAHLGLIGMQERVRSFSGSFQIWSKPGCGTRVTFQLPMLDV